VGVGGCDCDDSSQRRWHGGAGAMVVVVDGGDGAQRRRARTSQALSEMVALQSQNLFRDMECNREIDAVFRKLWACNRIILVTWNAIAKLMQYFVNYACIQSRNYFSDMECNRECK
jgi:hypothetical protein